jgi:hypothetical protein
VSRINHEGHEDHEGLCVRPALRSNKTGENKPHLIYRGLFSRVLLLRKPPSAAARFAGGRSNAFVTFVIFVSLRDLRDLRGFVVCI